MKKSEGAPVEKRQEDHTAIRVPHSELDPSVPTLSVSEADEPDAVLLQRWLDLNA